MEKIVAVSACLIGKNCKYNGKNNYNQAVINYLSDKKYILICPESMGGLCIPREPSEIKNNKVYSKSGKDVSDQFELGANNAFSLSKKAGVNEYILKSNSPSCGYKKIYDGTFSGNIISGNGVFVNKLINENVTIYTEKDIEEIEVNKND